MPKARSSDRSLGLALPLSESYTNTSDYVLRFARCRLHSGVTDFNVARREARLAPLEEDKGIRERVGGRGASDRGLKPRG